MRCTTCHQPLRYVDSRPCSVEHPGTVHRPLGVNDSFAGQPRTVIVQDGGEAGPGLAIPTTTDLLGLPPTSQRLYIVLWGCRAAGR